ncbi:hypothetical protein TI05_05455 [Achromatium sp. WMS3]|nr:hypothetical protein TI05_05455 [Achromatium sp. WMS3]
MNNHRLGCYPFGNSTSYNDVELPMRASAQSTVVNKILEFIKESSISGNRTDIEITQSFQSICSEWQ